MDKNVGSPTFCTSGLKSIHLSLNIHACFPIIGNNVKETIALEVNDRKAGDQA